MNTPSEGLDYIVRQDEDGSFQVWTPDTTGAVIGIGTTRKEALANAVDVAKAFIDTIIAENEASPHLPGL